MITDTFTLNNDYGRKLLVVKANGGSVAVQKQVGTDWVTTDMFTTDGGYVLDLFNTATRFVPANGAVFEISK
jgi:hypothetical protein